MSVVADGCYDMISLRERSADSASAGVLLPVSITSTAESVLC